MKKLLLAALGVLAFASTAYAAAPPIPPGRPGYGPITDVGGQYYNARAYGMRCDDTTDDTAALNALLTTLNAGHGGTIFLPGVCLISGQVTLPNDSASSPNQKPIRITGQGLSANGYWLTPVAGNSGLDLQFNAARGKILTFGSGVLEIDHMTLKDGASDCAPFLYTTNTTLRVHDNLFSGTASQGSACNKMIILGGTGVTIGNDPNAPFQGYGTDIHDNFFDKCETVVLFQNFANAVSVHDNTVSLSCGSVNAGGAAFEFNHGSNGGNSVVNNLIEVGSYPYGFLMDSGANTDFLIGNKTFDRNSGAGKNISEYACVGGGHIIIPAVVSGTTDATAFGTCTSGSTSNIIFATQHGATVTHFPVITTQNFTMVSTAGKATLPIGSGPDQSCIEMQNSDASNVTNYITVLNGTITATTTKPGSCR